jgi:hypothetical protein
MAYQVDYKALKENVSITQVLDYYGLTATLRKTKEGYEGLCPFHETKHLERRPFKVNVDKNAFHCFSCKAKGNILDFVARKENDTIHASALKLKAWFLGDTKAVPVAPEKQSEERVVNQPLTFMLKLESEHPHLKHLPITLETLQEFGAGYCSRGLHQGRLAVPVQNEKGELVAYISYALTGRNSYDQVKYPENFDSSLVLFNYHPDIAEVKPLLLFPTVLDLLANSHDCFRKRCAVALFDYTLSDAQLHLIKALRPQTLELYWSEGKHADLQTIVYHLSQHFFVKRFELQRTSAVS